MKTRLSNFKIILIFSLLISLEVIWLLHNMKLLRISFLDSANSDGGQKIGYVVKAQQQLKKRSMNSLMWESSGANESLQYYDSLLTLGQSSATLSLENNTEIVMSENTLVTLEPVDEKESSQIRLRFSKGDLAARNPNQKTQVKGQSWDLNIEKGSQLQVRQVGENIEIEMASGKSQLVTEKGQQEIRAQEVLRLNKDLSVQKNELDQKLIWKDQTPKRIYTHNGEATVSLAWQGDGEHTKLEVSSLDKTPQMFDLKAGRSDYQLSLALGEYNVRLLSEKGISQSRKFQIWSAPVIHLMSPLPRDRVQQGQNVSFIWMSLPTIQHYQFAISSTGGNTHNIEKDIDGNFVDFNFTNDTASEWSVKGYDADGFEIPYAYKNQIYPQFSPLAAPRVKTPELRLPAGSKKPPDGASYRAWPLKVLSLLIPEARAEAKENFEAVFEWEQVPGAEHYIIEISKEAHFRNPILTEKVKTQSYTWKQVELGAYYWRVAAGNKTQMGYFSEPELVDFANLSQQENKKSGGVTLKKVESKEKDDLLEIVKPEPTATPIPAEQPTPAKVKELKSRYGFAYAPGWTSTNYKKDDDLNIKLSGQASTSFALDFDFVLNNERYMSLQTAYLQQNWKIKNPDDYPFQDKQSSQQFRATALIGHRDTSWLWGVRLEKSLVFARKAPEAVEVQTATFMGPSLECRYDFATSSVARHQLSLTNYNKYYEANLEQAFKSYFIQYEREKFYMGLELDLKMQKGEGNSETRAGGVYLLLGLDSF